MGISHNKMLLIIFKAIIHLEDNVSCYANMPSKDKQMLKDILEFLDEEKIRDR